MMEERIRALWADMDAQRWEMLPSYFAEDALILWPNTSERFTVMEYARANSEYPGDWAIDVERVEGLPGLVISVVRIRLIGGDTQLHAVSFFEHRDGYVTRLTEYYGDDAPPPTWRIEKGIGIQGT